jgi:hypothetical protein
MFGSRARQEALEQAQAEARHWYDRLDGQLLSVDAGANPTATQALTDANERLNAAGREMERAKSVSDYRLGRESAIEGLYYLRAARTALGLDAGPELPPLASQLPPGVQAPPVSIGGQVYAAQPTSSADSPYYYPGGVLGGRRVGGGWYSHPFWTTALLGGAVGIGGVMLADEFLGGGFDGGGGYGDSGFDGGGYGDGGFDGGFDGGGDFGGD